MSYNVVHYINQFFANIGGEAEIAKTIVCGDSYFAEHEADAKSQILEWVKAEKPDFFLAGPAFNAGRYGYACATICAAVQDELGIPVLTGMYEENPGADLKNKILIVATANSAAGMRKAAPAMAKLALKIMKGEKLGASCEEGYMPNGIRKNFFEKKVGAERAVDMLVAKLNGKPFTTEYPMPSFDRVAPNPAVKDLSKATIALCTSGGIVPKGNPDHIESSSASHYGEYCIAGVQEHVFNYREPKKIMAGESFISPEALLKRLNDTAKSGHKIHISEVTITGNDDSPKSRARQALYAENQYRLWFSYPNVMGITWWNTVDDCGMKNEPSHSGIFTRDMQPKPVYHVLDNLINKEWKTNLTVKPDSDGKISFRGFRGTYKISWKDKYGRDRQMLYHLK